MKGVVFGASEVGRDWKVQKQRRRSQWITANGLVCIVSDWRRLEKRHWRRIELVIVIVIIKISVNFVVEIIFMFVFCDGIVYGVVNLVH